VRSALGTRLDQDASRAYAACQEAAEELLASLLVTHDTGRESALDLLAADALVTYAFEYAAATPEELDERAASAMQRIVEIGARFADNGAAVRAGAVR